MIEKWIVSEPVGRRRGCIIGLTGRGMSADTMETICYHMDVPATLKISLQPELFRWYPQPNGAEDQSEAVEGLVEALHVMDKKLKQIQRAFRLRRSQIALVGYSAGAVMSLQLAFMSKQPFAAVVSLAGAILEPHKVPAAPNQTPILLRHAVDDECFSWEERYLPMKDALIDNGYNLSTSEKMEGGHGINRMDVDVASRFIAPKLGYKQRYFEEEE